MADNKAMQRITAEEISAFCNETALMLSAGMQLYDGMETLAQTWAGTPREAQYRALERGMAETGSLYEALKQDARWPVHMVEMVGVGERTGRLEEVMKGLEAYYAREKRIRDAVVSAVTYPLLLAGMLAVIVFVMLWAVLPVFRRMLGSMRVAMTATGQAMMDLGMTVGWIVLALVALAVIGALVVLVMMRLGNRQAVIDWVCRTFPPVGRLRRKLAASRVFSVMSMMISGGFRMDEALGAIPPVLDDPEAVRRVTGIGKAMEEGRPLGEALTASGLLEPMHARMIGMAASVGREDEVMARIAQLCEEQVEDDLSGLVSIIEPTLVALLCVVIGAILLSVMLPMAGMIASIM